jgi:hypothetical protein
LIQPLSPVRRAVASVLFAAATLLYWVMLQGRPAPTGEGLGMLAVLAGLDALAIAVLWIRPSSAPLRSAVGWYGLLRFAVSVLLFNLPSAILYVFAGFLVASAPRRPFGGSATTKHEFTAASGGWIGAMTPLTASRSIAGALASSRRECAVCGRGQEDPLHWASEA